MFAVPRRYSAEGVKRFGFLGLSYEYIADQLPWIDARAAGGRTVVAHLGNGASLCAMRNGSSVATTMGFTALDGLVMGTRCGSIDPGVLLYLIDRHELTPMALKELLYEQSGLLGVSELSGDMRTLLTSGDARAIAADWVRGIVHKNEAEWDHNAAQQPGDPPAQLEDWRRRLAKKIAEMEERGTA